MTHISKQKLSPKIRRELAQQFVQLFSDQNSRHMEMIYQTLFTSSEQVMFVKRLAIIFMLEQKHSTYATAKALKVSDQTVRAARKKLQSGEYDQLLTVIRRPEFNDQKFWELISKALRLGMPSYNSNQWPTIEKHLRKKSLFE